jgi:hypothetical protein
MKFARPFLALLVGCLLLSGAGCGYTRKTALPRDIKTIYVDTFQNHMMLGEIYAYEPGLEIKITNAVIRRLQIDGNLKVMPREKADAVLEGELTAIRQDGVRFTGLERIEEYRLYLVVNLKLRDPKTGEILWEEIDFSGDASYFVTGPRAVSRGEALERATGRLARNIVDRIVEDW